MNWERFCRLAETWGGEIELWPEQERIGAQRFAKTAEGTEVLMRARMFDRLLAVAPSVGTERAGIASFNVIQRIAAQNGRKSHWFSRLEWLVPGTSLACSVVVGVSLAFAAPYERPTQEQLVLRSMILDSVPLPIVW
jgi:hypothetical protein